MGKFYTSAEKRVILRIDPSSVYGRGLLKGIGKYIKLHGDWVFYREFPYSHQETKKQIEAMRSWGASGMIIRDIEPVEELLELDIPVIICPNIIASQSIHEKIKQCPSITTDCEAIGTMAAEYFLNRGFQQFAFCGFEEFGWSRRRRKAFSQTIQEAGYPTYYFEPLRTDDKYSWLLQQKQMVEWLKSLPKPVAMMACNDERGLDVIEACKAANIYIPEEVAVIGVDNDEVACEVFNPPLSSIAINTEKAGYQAAELLDRMMTGQEVEEKPISVAPLYPITRRSTDIVAIDDPYVAEAVNFMRENAKRQIQVTDVVRAVSLSRRNLEKRFKKTLGKSIFEELRRLKTEQIIKMLLETDLLIGEIAYKFGFPDSHNVARYFKKVTGMSMQAYRKKYTGKDVI